MHSLPFIEDFEKKSREVRRYCLFLKGVESHAIQLSLGGAFVEQTKIRNLDTDLETTLKGAVFLLLYNLVESTLRDGIQYIYDVLKNNQVPFDHLNQSFQSTIIKVIKTMAEKDLGLSQWKNGISLDIVYLVCQQEINFSGNLDSKKIREMLANYGLTIDQGNQKARGGKDLREIKDARKLLAHGHSSFSEKGRAYSADDLLEMQKRVDKYLKGVLIKIDEYVSKKEYLKDRA
ncbi:MAG: MAE_28990/MAE_18760 family HEPN-like nuclease [Synechocystis sp.]|nr:MAE_28990/MAE_18760 family HEPN-like nuclease [Synechocystis sp.]